MPDLHLPKPTTWNERGMQRDITEDLIDANHKLAALLKRECWRIHKRSDGLFDIFQPLFGLTAKDTTGKVRTVVEGNVVYLGDPDAQTPCGIILYHQHGFVIATNLGVCPIQEFIDEGNAPMILCHCTDIVAAGNKLTCWECHGSGRVVSCPTCHGEGQHKIVWKG